jgi:hypothetical protein
MAHVAANLSDAQASADARKAPAAIENAQLDNVCQHADFIPPSEPKPEPGECPGGEPARVAMVALCWLVVAASPDLGDPLLAEHLATIAAAQDPDPFPVENVDRVIALLTDVAARLRAKGTPEADPLDIPPCLRREAVS